MTNKTQTQDRDDVLFAFHQAHAKPTAQEIFEWAERYPEFAEDIRAHAAISHDWAAHEDVSEERPSESSLASAFSRALTALYDGELEAASASAAATNMSRTLRDMLAACGKDVPVLQREIGGSVGIARSVLADLFNGAMLSPLSNRLHGSVVRALSTTAGEFQAALERTLLAPRFGHANANVTPIVNVRSCEDIIRTSGMTPLQVRYWLDGD